MVTLPEIDHYSEKEIDSLISFSPISGNYLKQLEKKPENFSQEIRISKHRHWLKCALASFFGKSDTEHICSYWTQETDKILGTVWKHFELDQYSVALLALGKLGSRELNLSSDIDIVFVAEDEAPLDQINPKLKKLIFFLNEVTPFSFAYRVDLNLRPGGDQSPLTPTKKQFYSYYDEYLEAWNRLSFIRMRGIVGDQKLISDIQSYCFRNAFPRRLDFSVVDEIKSIRSKINYQWRKANEPFDIKLSPGGIRDIELFVQSLQVIYGGKDQDLQISSFTQALNLLISKKIIAKEDGEFLSKFYWQLRQVENLIHAKEDQHTYLLKKDFFTKELPCQWNEEDILKNLEKCEVIVGGFFEDKPEAPKEASISTEISASAKRSIEKIRELQPRSMKQHKINQIKGDILDQFVAVSQSIGIDIDLSLGSFKDFIYAIKSKSSIFHLLHRHPKLVEDLAWLFSVSPFIGQILSRRPELMDSFVLGQVDVSLNDDFEDFLENLGDYKLLGHLFATIDLFKKKDITAYCKNLSQQADFIVSQLRAYLTNQLPSQPHLDILCLGKWSGLEMGIRSDLDFVFLSDTPPTGDQTKIARRLINNLTATGRAGKLFDIDLRLKPNENAGPLILERSKFSDFIKNDAEGWQKQAYLRSRVLGNTEAFYKTHFESLRLSKEEVLELEKIHNKLITAGRANQIDIKVSPGGIVETEFTLQKLCLLQKNIPKSSSTIDILEALKIDSELKNKISKNYKQLRFYEQSLQICNDNSSTKVAKNNQNLIRMARVLGESSVFDALIELTTDQGKLLKSLDLNY